MKTGTGERKEEAGPRAVYRRIILGLVRALCEIPKAERQLWLDELMARDAALLDPDEILVRPVLINSLAGESFAEQARERMKPKLYPIVGRDLLLSDRSAGARVRRRRPRRDPDGPLPAA
jgi:hypothetical protein